MYLVDIALALACIFFGLAVLVPVVQARCRFQRYVGADGTVIAPEMAEQMLETETDAHIDLQWLDSPWQNETDLAEDGWHLAGEAEQPLYMAMLGFGGITLLATAVALPLGLGRNEPVLAFVTFAVAALFGACGLYRIGIALRAVSAHPLDHVHLVLALLALLAGIRLY